MCLSPDEMTTEQLKELAEYYDGLKLTYQSEQIRALIAEREANGTAGVVPEVTPRHLNSATS